MPLFNYHVPAIYAAVDTDGDTYENSIEGYKKNEFWGNWSMPLSHKLETSIDKTFSIKGRQIGSNIQDYNLNTAWFCNLGPIFRRNYFQFTFRFPKNTSYAAAYQFQGICKVFNGYCKSAATWKKHGWVKRMRVHYNGTPVCEVLLKDTWHYQSFNISKCFLDCRNKKNLTARHEINNGDKLKFKIVEIYPGTQYHDAAISELLGEG